MVTSISSSSASGAPIRGLQGLKKLKRDDARAALTNLQIQVAGKPGVLKLMHTRKDQDMVFERKSWYQAIARRQGKMDNTAEALKTLYERAELSSKAKAELVAYLESHNNRVGGSSLARLIQGHLKPKSSDHVMNQVLPKETNHNWALRKDIFGSRDERTVGCVSPHQETQAERDANINARDQRNLQFQRDNPDLNPNYLIGTGPNDPQRLHGISRSANAAMGQQFDLSKPIVLFFGGSHGNTNDYAYPAAAAAGPAYAGGLNFLAVDYRGFGQSGHTRPTPKSVTDDAMRVYEHVRSLGFPPEKIILRGYSLGAAAVGRIHAAADLQGEKLMAVVYDRPMASAADAAKSKFGSTAGWLTQNSVGRFGANQYLEVINTLGSKDMSSTLVIADNQQVLGPRAEQMAKEHRAELVQLGQSHEAHWHANDALTNLFDRVAVSNTYARDRLKQAIRDWLDMSHEAGTDRDLEAIKLLTQWFKNLERAENRARQDNGSAPLESMDDLADLMGEVARDLVRDEGDALTPLRLAHWQQRLENSPALGVLSRIADRVNDELLAPRNSPERSTQLEFIKDQSQDASILVVQLRSAMGLPALAGSWYVEPNDSNTSIEMKADIEKLFAEAK